MTDEAQITVNGAPLSLAQSMTIRVALESFAYDLTVDGLGADDHAKAMTALYLERISEIRRALYVVQNQAPITESPEYLAYLNETHKNIGQFHND